MIGKNKIEQAQRLSLATIMFCLGAAAVYWIWPGGVTDLPLAAITLSQLLRTIASVILALLTLSWTMSVLDA